LIAKREKILLTGGSGLVGSYLEPILDRKKFELSCIQHESELSVAGNLVKADLASAQDVWRVVRDIAPDIIVNLAADTNVDGCEVDPAMASSLNSELVATLAQYAASKDAYLLHLSTDYVFEGSMGNYREHDTTNPVNIYGRTKLEGERQIRSTCRKEQWCIARTSTPFGRHPKKVSFPVFVLDKLRKNEIITVVTDQHTSPTYTANLARMLNEVLERRITGLIHTAGASRLSRYEQALEVTKVFNLDSELIVKTTAEQMSWKAARPRDTSLNVEHAESILAEKPQAFASALREFAKVEAGNLEPRTSQNGKKNYQTRQ
jgi:dTDP-4-dehydrorhamnose reductase